MQVPSLALLSGLRILHCHELWCRSQLWCRRSDPTLLWLWCRLAAAAPVLPLAQELPNAAREAQEGREGRREEGKKEGNREFPGSLAG